MIYYTSDLQFGHQAAHIAFHRPFNNVKEMDTYMIRAWNNRVETNDTVYICGDFSTYDISRTKSILRCLNGNKVLIFGNHDDELRVQPDLSNFFVDAVPMMEISYNSLPICLCHYPMLEWPGDREGGFLVCGHVHNREHGHSYNAIMALPTILNAGVDINHFKPVKLLELWQNNSEFYTPRAPLYDCNY